MRELRSVHYTKGSCLRGTTCLRYSIKNNIVLRHRGKNIILWSVWDVRMSSSMEFCETVLWDSNLTWYTDTPQVQAVSWFPTVLQCSHTHGIFESIYEMGVFLGYLIKKTNLLISMFLITFGLMWGIVCQQGCARDKKNKRQ